MCFYSLLRYIYLYDILIVFVDKINSNTAQIDEIRRILRK